MLLIFWLNHLTPGAKRPNFWLVYLMATSSSWLRSPWHKLHDDTVCFSISFLNSNMVSNTKPIYHVLVDLMYKPLDPREAYLLYLLHDLYVCHYLSSTTPSPSPLVHLVNLVNNHLDLINMVYPSTCILLVNVPICTHAPSFDPLGHSIQDSMFILCYSQSTGTNLLDIHHYHWSSICFTPAHQHNQETCCTTHLCND